MYKTGDTRRVPYVIFLLNGISCTGLFHYGLLLGNTTITFLNGVGLVLQWTYVLMYLALVQPKGRSVVYFLTALVYLGLFYLYLVTIVIDAKKIESIVGGTASLICTIVVSLPALEVIQNIKNKNTDGMPLIMLLGGLACSSSWLIYGLLLNDANVYQPNIPGILITLVKLYVIQLYSKAEKTKTA